MEETALSYALMSPDYSQFLTQQGRLAPLGSGLEPAIFPDEQKALRERLKHPALVVHIWE